jgi:cellulose/xylan binding protein with CBM9 domain
MQNHRLLLITTTIAIFAVLNLSQVFGKDKFTPIWAAKQLKTKAFIIGEDYAQSKYGDAWDFGEGDNEGIDEVSGLKDVTYKNGVMGFKVERDLGFFVWGNYNNQHPEYGQENFNYTIYPNQSATIKLRIKQSLEKSLVKVIFYNQGRNIKTATFNLTGTEWQDLAEKVNFGNLFGKLSTCDAIKVQFSPKGNRIQIDSIKMSSDWRGGSYRYKLLIDDNVRSASFYIFNGYDFYINGHLAYKGYKGFFWTDHQMSPVECAKYFKKGANVIAFRALRADISPIYPKIYLQGGILCDSGKYIEILTDEHGWRFNPLPQKGWTKANFDDSHWKNVETMPGKLTLYKPFYTGPILVHTENGEDPIFTEKQGVKLVVEAPANMKLSYNIENMNKTEIMKRQKSDAGFKQFKLFKKADGINVYHLILKSLTPSSYRLLIDGGSKHYEKREYEFAVVGKIKQREVAGKTFEEGMQLKLVEEINCSDKNDPHPFLDDGKSSIQSSSIGKYRVTGNSRGNFFGYMISFKTLYKPHLVVVEYPDLKEQALLCRIAVKVGNGGRAMSTPAFWTGVEYPYSGKMEKLRFIHYPSAKTATIDIHNAQTGRQAAVSKIKIYEIQNDLPALKINGANQRMIGPLTERSDIVYSTFNMSPTHTKMMNRYFINSYYSTYKDWYPALKNFVKYLRFCGYNSYAAGVYMYESMEFPTNTYRGRHNHLTDYLALMAKIFEENNLKFFANVELNWIESQQALFNAKSDVDVALGHDTVQLVSKDGSQHKMNHFHPKSIKLVDGIFEEIAQRYSKYPAFAGINSIENLKSWGINFFGLDYGYGDYTIALFEKESGIKIPVSQKDLKRFGKRYDWLMKNKKDEWLAWRGKKVSQRYAEIHEKIKSYRKDLKFIITTHYQNLRKDIDFAKFQEHMIELSSPHHSLPEKDGLYSNHMYFQSIANRHQQSGNRLKGDLTFYKFNESKEVVDYMKKAGNNSRFAFMRTGFDELWQPHLRKIKTKKDWPFKFVDHTCYYDTPGHEHDLDLFNKIMDYYDPEIIFDGLYDVHFRVGHEETRRKFNQSFRSLPLEKFTTIKDADTNKNLIVKKLIKGNTTWLYIINPVWWDLSFDISFQNNEINQIKDVVADSNITPRNIKMGPYGFNVYCIKSTSHDIKIKSTIVEKDLARLKKRISVLEKMLQKYKDAKYGYKQEEALIKQAKQAFRNAEFLKASKLIFNAYFYPMIYAQDELKLFTKKDAPEKQDRNILPFMTSKEYQEPFKAVIAKNKNKVIIDGDLGEWDKSSPIVFNNEEQNANKTEWNGVKDASGLFYLKWDKEALYFAAEILDDSAIAWDADYPCGGICQGDEIELFISTIPKARLKGSVGGKAYQIFLLCGSQKSAPKIIICKGNGELKGQKIALVRRQDKKGYTMEVKLPWKTVFSGYVPKTGDIVGFNLAFADIDFDAVSGKKSKKKTYMSYNGKGQLFISTKNWLSAIFK